MVESVIIYYRRVKNFGDKKVWRMKTIGSLAEITLANGSPFAEGMLWKW